MADHDELKDMPEDGRVDLTTKVPGVQAHRVRIAPSYARGAVHCLHAGSHPDPLVFDDKGPVPPCPWCLLARIEQLEERLRR